MPGAMPRARRLAELLLERARLSSGRGVSREQVVEALAGVLAVTPPASPHGRLLAAALAPPAAQRPKGRPVQRSREQQAVWHLLTRGESPTPEAVAGELARAKEHWQAEERRAARVRAVLEDGGQGPRAAVVVAERWRTAGAGPTWWELGDAMGWPRRKLEREALIRALERAGWLATGTKPRSLRPGPRLRRLASEQARMRRERASRQEPLEDVARLMTGRPRPR